MNKEVVVKLSPEEVAIAAEIEKARAGLPTTLEDIPESVLEHKVGEPLTLEYMRVLAEYVAEAVAKMKAKQ